MEQKSNHTVAIAVVTGLIALLLGVCLGGLVGGFGGYLIGRGANVNASVRTERGGPPPLQATPLPAVPDSGAQPVVPSTTGIVIEEVVAGSPAEAAGLQPGDIITQFDGATLAANHNLANLVARHQPGDKVQVHIMRGSTERDVTVELGARADDSSAAYLGVRYTSP
jgi:membrane-associated protease RseP (regulator of RpoE activity)